MTLCELVALALRELTIKGEPGEFCEAAWAKLGHVLDEREAVDAEWEECP